MHVTADGKIIVVHDDDLKRIASVELANEKVPNLVITKRANDFGECDYGSKKLYRIPAPAFLYLLGLVESQKNQHKA